MILKKEKYFYVEILEINWQMNNEKIEQDLVTRFETLNTEKQKQPNQIEENATDPSTTK